MKNGQVLIEYMILSALTVIIVAAAFVAFNIPNIGSNNVFGIKIKEHTVLIPPMTP